MEIIMLRLIIVPLETMIMESDLIIQTSQQYPILQLLQIPKMVLEQITVTISQFKIQILVTIQESVIAV